MSLKYSLPVFPVIFDLLMSIVGCPPSGVKLQTLSSRVIKAEHRITTAWICSGLLLAHCLIAPNVTKAPCWNEILIYLWVLCCMYGQMLQRRWIVTLGTKVSIMALINGGKPLWNYMISVLLCFCFAKMIHGCVVTAASEYCKALVNL